MRAFRLVTAFLLAPWVPVVGYYAVYAALASSRGGDAPSATAFVAALAPVSYAATTIAWLPFVFVLRRFGRDRFVPLAAGGAALGAAIGAAGLAASGRTVLADDTSAFLIVATALGLLFGAAFWAIALFHLERTAQPC